MATTSLGVIPSRFQVNAPSFRSHGAQRGFLLAPGRSFRAFRTIRKARSPRSPRLSRSFSRRARIVAMAEPSFMSLKLSSGNTLRFAREEGEEEDVTRRSSSTTEEGDENRVVETINAVLADVLDGQQFLKETGRTKSRPMRRRALVVCLALGAFRGGLDERPMPPSRLSRVPSLGFGRTAHLVSQISFGASSPRSPAVDSRLR